jgi:hypothetical protein
LSLSSVIGDVAGDVDFKSTGGGSSFVDGTLLGTANGSTSGGASGKADGKTDGFDVGAPVPGTVGDLVFRGSSAAGGKGAFVASFYPSFQDRATGGSGSGSGSPNPAGSGNAKPVPNLPYLEGETSDSGTAGEANGGGSGSASHMFGEAGGLGLVATKGGALGRGGSVSTGMGDAPPMRRWP